MKYRVGGIKMKILKAVVFSIAGLLMAACLGILVCALNPSLTAMLAEQVEHMAENNGQEDGGTGTDGSLDNVRLPGMPGLVELPGDKDIYQVPENMPRPGNWEACPDTSRCSRRTSRLPRRRRTA